MVFLDRWIGISVAVLHLGGLVGAGNWGTDPDVYELEVFKGVWMG